jgi:hypothetical protein
MTICGTASMPMLRHGVEFQAPLGGTLHLGAPTRSSSAGARRWSTLITLAPAREMPTDGSVDLELDGRFALPPVHQGVEHRRANRGRTWRVESNLAWLREAWVRPRTIPARHAITGTRARFLEARSR